MAFFSRRKSRSQDPPAPDADADTQGDEATTDTPPDLVATGRAASTVQDDQGTDATSGDVAESQTTGDEAAASVDISMSSFHGVGSVAAEAAVVTARPMPPAEAPQPTETVPGLRDNALLCHALAELPESPAPQQILNVARQLLQGHVFLRVQGDARALLAEGKNLPLGIATQGDRQFVLVYSSGEAIQAAVRADGNTNTSAMAQPVFTVFRQVLASTYAGIILDHSSPPARVTLPRDLLERALKDMQPDLAVKTSLTTPRTEATAAEVVEAIMRSPVWLAANRSSEGEPIGITESRTPEGARLLDVFSHPLEVIAMDRGDQPVPITAVLLAAALTADKALAGFIVDPAGPWIRLSRRDLAPLIALASPGGAGKH